MLFLYKESMQNEWQISRAFVQQTGKRAGLHEKYFPVLTQRFPEYSRISRNFRPDSYVPDECLTSAGKESHSGQYFQKLSYLNCEGGLFHKICWPAEL